MSALADVGAVACGGAGVAVAVACESGEPSGAGVAECWRGWAWRERCEFVGLDAAEDILRSYHRIDIGLDPFPYAGGTTTCDALWMGVPVVTLRGQRAVGRGGVSILSTLGVPQWIAETREEYVGIAAGVGGGCGAAGGVAAEACGSGCGSRR